MGDLTVDIGECVVHFDEAFMDAYRRGTPGTPRRLSVVTTPAELAPTSTRTLFRCVRLLAHVGVERDARRYLLEEAWFEGLTITEEATT
jgi:hypothetical protein